MEIDVPPQQRRQPVLDTGESEERHFGSRLEVGQDVDSAEQAEIVAEHGAEEREPLDSVPTAELRQSPFRDRHAESLDHAPCQGREATPFKPRRPVP